VTYQAFGLSDGILFWRAIVAFLVFGPVIDVKMLALPRPPSPPVRSPCSLTMVALLTAVLGLGGEPCDLTAEPKAGSRLR
jgi:hypothetical protein